MGSPFPGMDPFLENPFFWHQVHSRLIVALANELGAKLRPKYYAAIETRTYLDDEDGSIFVGIPDAIVFRATSTHRSPLISGSSILLAPQPQRVRLVEPIECKERYLEIRKVDTHHVILAIEVLSPKNKRGDGRKSYLKKRQTLLETNSHFIEIDLLRALGSMPVIGIQSQSHYRILVSKADDRPEADLYSFNLQDPIPVIPIPLQPEDEPVAIDLANLLRDIYEQGCFDLQINYQDPVPAPDLSEADRAWVKQVLSG
jgi:Protein of unknown function (DUF4058)